VDQSHRLFLDRRRSHPHHRRCLHCYQCHRRRYRYPHLGLAGSHLLRRVPHRHPSRGSTDRFLLGFHPHRLGRHCRCQHPVDQCLAWLPHHHPDHLRQNRG